MPKHFTSLLLLYFISINSFAQIDFEKGYFIKVSNGEKVECLIKNVDWKNNPVAFEYKLSANAEKQTANIQTAKEFGIYGSTKYVGRDVKIDKSSDNINKLNSIREPPFELDSLYLEVLVEGKATLLYYEDGNLKRYFYQIDGGQIQQLVYRRFYVNKTEITVNNYFRQQLYLQFKCGGMSSSKISNLNYKKNDLKEIFIKYNKCSNASYKVFEPNKNRDKFNLTIRPGLNYSKLSVFNVEGSARNIDFGKKTNYRIGLEAEIILPYNKNKWSIIVEPTYQYYRSEAQKNTTDISGGIIKAKVKYQSIEIPIGLRYSIFLNESKIFTNLLAVLDINSATQIEYTRNDGSSLYNIDIDSGINLAFGVGYQYKKRLSAELRIYSKRDLLSNYISWYSAYNTYSFIIGFTLF